MLNDIATSDIVLSLIVTFGMIQMAWFSVMLIRRNVPARMIQQAIPAFLTVWVLMWPVYIDARWLGIGFIALLMPMLLATFLHTPFWQHLNTAWAARHVQAKNHHAQVFLPQVHLLIALGIAGLWFQMIPEFGFGLALCLCIAFPAAYWVDHIGQRYGFLILGFPAHPQQTLAGHLILIITCTILLSWSLHVYHGTDWQSLFMATLIASTTASVCRALVPGQWNAVAAVLSIGSIMWLL